MTQARAGTPASRSARSSSSSGEQSAIGRSRAALRASARGSLRGRGAPLPVHRAHLGGQHVLPPRIHDMLDPELERNLSGVGHVLGVAKDRGMYGRIVDPHPFARDGELVTAGLRLGAGLESVTAVPPQVVPLRRSRDDEHKEAVLIKDRTYRMEPWGAVSAHGGEKGQSNVELKEQRAAH